MRRELLIGAGARREKNISLEGLEKWSSLTTLDIDARHSPDIQWNLEHLPLPFEDDSFDEIHAYEVLEHTGRQGDYHFFFEQFADFWRILRPDGVLLGTSPAANSPWAWGDPGHTRIICPECFVFLNQAEYTKQIGHTPMTDYRFWFKADFELVLAKYEGHSFIYGLRAIKPSRITL